MSRRPRLRSHSDHRRGDLICAAWGPSGLNRKKEDIAHVLSCKIASEGTSASKVELNSFDFKEELLSEMIVQNAEDDLPESIAVHPGGDGVLCSFSHYFKLYEIERKEHVSLKVSDRNLVSLEGMGPQVALIFSTDGSRLAAAQKNGHLRVFEWPSLNILIDRQDGCSALGSVDISLDGAFLAAIPATGHYCRLWDIDKAELITTIQTSNKTELFGHCRFSRDGTKPFLFVTLSKGGVDAIGVWVMDSWTKVGIKTFSKDPITSLATSRDGKLLAIGDTAGNIRLIEVKNMRTSQLLKNVGMSAVTLVEFSPDGRAVLFLTSDATLGVRKRNLSKEWKEWQIYMLLLGLILASAVLFYIFFEHSDSFWKFPLGRNQPARPPPEAIYGRMSDFDGGELM